MVAAIEKDHVIQCRCAQRRHLSHVLAKYRFDGGIRVRSKLFVRVTTSDIAVRVRA